MVGGMADTRAHPSQPDICDRFLISPSPMRLESQSPINWYFVRVLIEASARGPWLFLNRRSLQLNRFKHQDPAIIRSSIYSSHGEHERDEPSVISLIYFTYILSHINSVSISIIIYVHLSHCVSTWYIMFCLVTMCLLATLYAQLTEYVSSCCHMCLPATLCAACTCIPPCIG